MGKSDPQSKRGNQKQARTISTGFFSMYGTYNAMQHCVRSISLKGGYGYQIADDRDSNMQPIDGRRSRPLFPLFGPPPEVGPDSWTGLPGLITRRGGGDEVMRSDSRSSPDAMDAMSLSLLLRDPTLSHCSSSMEGSPTHHTEPPDSHSHRQPLFFLHTHTPTRPLFFNSHFDILCSACR